MNMRQPLQSTSPSLEGCLADLSRIPFLEPEWLSLGYLNGSCHNLMQRTHVLPVTSGRAAIYLALRALNVGPGSTVLVPSYHCPTMIAPIVALGARPQFYPITASGCVDQNYLDALPPDGVRAIIAAHFFGLPRPMQALRTWCTQRGVALVEDCAHTLYGTSDGKPVGAWGDFAIGSLTKFLPVTEGGVLVSNHEPVEEIALQPRQTKDQVRILADLLELLTCRKGAGLLSAPLRGLFLLKKKLRSPKQSTVASTESDIDRPREAWDGFKIDVNFATTRPAHATEWLARHIDLDKVATLRRNNARQLLDALSHMQGAHALVDQLPEHAVPYVLPFWVDNPEPVYRRLKAMRFPVYRWDRLWPDVPSLPKDQGPLWSRHVFQLVCHQSQTEQDIQRMADAFRQACQQN